MSRLAPLRKERLREIYARDGLQMCLKEAGSNTEAKIVCEGLNYNYFVMEAESIVKTLEQGGSIPFDYLGEKIRHVVSLGDTVTRFEKESRWRDVHNYMLEKGF